jgi:prepilin-type processing-associated H-X9-DG protein/prepilin-type N-terminal cleavage/methylation domain-containing protein
MMRRKLRKHWRHPRSLPGYSPLKEERIMGARRGASLIEVLVVMAIMGVLIAMFLGGVVQAREAAGRVSCQNNLRQIGHALQSYHAAYNYLPSGLVCQDTTVVHSDCTGFAYLLPFLELDNIAQMYHYDVSWHDQSNFDAVGYEIKVFFCPSNRSQGVMELALEAGQWGVSIPSKVGSCDYAFCKGANGALPNDTSKIPLAVRGVFGVQPDDSIGGTRMEDILDGTSSTIAVGDATGNSPRYEVRSLAGDGSATDPLTGKTALLDQAWGAAATTETAHPFYGSIFAVTAQYGLAPDPRDEPMNRRPGTPTYTSSTFNNDNASGKDSVSGFRSLHSRGCNFLFCDGSVRFVPQTIRPDVYRALSTFAGGESIADAGY